MLKNDFESTNFADFEEVFHNAYIQYMQTWFDAQLDQ